MKKASPYMNWAKTQQQATYNLALSGVIGYPLAELPVTIEELEINGANADGYAPLLQALATKFKVAPECVVHSAGTSMANHLAMATMLEPGDEVLVEYPAYDPLLAVPRYLGAQIKRFARRFEDGFRLDVQEIARQLTPQTRLIVLTNFHNPSGVLTDNDTLKHIGELAHEVGARVLVDEVYLEVMFEKAPPSSIHLGKEFVVTSSLTKAYGLSGLRCGWVLADAELATRMRRLNDLYGAVSPFAADYLSLVALQNLEKISARAKSILEPNRVLLNEFLDGRKDLQAVRTEFGTTSFPRLLNGSVEALCTVLRDKYETSVVPGKFFEMPQHFRIGICCATAIIKEGLARLGAALDDLLT
ncbi:MAG: aminotransferase class I/II-fold pyridoxal phosphate-dependent enzyme [Acidobacteria bacterium]|nr:aminotransferase class I/II-fold pyridoxal phosphate-dependent enzyme [Acidobacteriota bacterium]